jgi:DNA primase
MPHPLARAVPILAAAAALGLRTAGRKACCFNGTAHRSGTDERPALAFQTEVNRFRCYACGVSGDVIDLVRAVRSCTFPEAIAWLSELAGGRRLPGPAAAPFKTVARTPTGRAGEVYARLYGLSQRLTGQSPGGVYLRGRGLDLDLVERHHVTELLDSRPVWDTLRTEFADDELRSAGLVSHRGRFLFGRHRLLFFTFGGGRPQFVQGRDVTGASPCKELSLAGVHSPTPYLGEVLDQAPRRVLVCEGCIDTLSAAQLGYAAVGVPGVTGFREEWFRLFRGVGHVTVLFDDDDPGRRQAVELRARFRLRGVRADAGFPARGKDLNDLLRALSTGDGREPK